ncbi:MAG: translation initiation factor IF-2 N-terminal domain-containing protein, partial [Burkholderiaceae bacterium]
MATSRVETFASELKLDVDVLLEQLKTAGVDKSSGADLISESDKEKLLEALRKAHGGVGDAPRRKITITKRQTSEIRQADPSGKSRTIQVEVRKKRVFVKRDEQESTEKPAVDAAPVLSEEEIQEREAEALRQRALLERQEEERLAKAKEEAEKADRLAAEQEKATAPVSEETDAVAEPSAPSDEDATDSATTKKSKVRKVSASEVADQQATEARRAVEDEVAAINKLMEAARTGKLAATVKAESEKPAAKDVKDKEATENKTMTLSKAPKKPGEESSDKPKDKKSEKSLKSAQLASTWQEDAQKRRALKTRGDASGGTSNWRSGPRARQRGSSDSQKASSFVAPTEPIVREVHIPETITVADLAHKMSVKGAEVVKTLMTMGQMVTINQVLD